MINAPYQFITTFLRGIKVNYSAAADICIYVYLHIVTTAKYKKQEIKGIFANCRCHLRLPNTIISNTNIKKCHISNCHETTLKRKVW